MSSQLPEPVDLETEAADLDTRLASQLSPELMSLVRQRVIVTKAICLRAGTSTFSTLVDIALQAG